MHLDSVCLEKGHLTDGWFILRLGRYFRVGKTKPSCYETSQSVRILAYIMRHLSILTQCYDTDAQTSVKASSHNCICTFERNRTDARTSERRVWYSSNCYWSLTSKNSVSSICQPQVSDSILLTDILIYRRKRPHCVFFFFFLKKRSIPKRSKKNKIY